MLLLILRHILLAILVALASTLGALFSLFRPTDPRNTYYVAKLFALFGKPILGYKTIVEDFAKNSNIDGGMVVSNHQSNYDIFLIPNILSKKTVSVGKKSLLYFPFFGLMYWLTGNILIDRGNKRKAWSTMDKVVDALKAGINIWIFPEGTRSKGRGLLPFKKGAFIVAIKAQKDIFPHVVSSFDKHVDLKKWNSGIIYFKTLDPISTKGLKPEDANDLRDKVYEIMDKELQELEARYKDNRHEDTKN